MGSLDFRWPTDQGLWSIGSLMKAWNLNCHVTECEKYPSHYLLFICFQWLVLMFISRKFCPHEECNSDNTCLNSTHCCNYRWLTLQSNDKTFLLCLSGYLRDLCQYLTQNFPNSNSSVSFVCSTVFVIYHNALVWSNFVSCMSTTNQNYEITNKENFVEICIFIYISDLKEPENKGKL